MANMWYYKMIILVWVCIALHTIGTAYLLHTFKYLVSYVYTSYMLIQVSCLAYLWHLHIEYTILHPFLYSSLM